MHVVKLKILLLLLFHISGEFSSLATSVREYAERKLDEYTTHEHSGIESVSDHVDSKEVLSYDVNFYCDKTFKGRIIETEYNLLLINGAQLYVINTNTSGSRVDILANLGDVSEELLDVKASFWDEKKIIVILAFSTHYNIYKVPFDDGTPSHFLPPIQKISIIAEKPVKIALYHRKDELYCLLVSKISEYRGILRLYNWHLMHFKEEAIQYVSGLSDIVVINWGGNNYDKAIIGVIHRGREKVEIHMLNGYNLGQFQTLHVDGHFIRLIELHSEAFLHICSAHYCDIHRWHETRFNHWRRINLPSDFDEFHSGHNVIIYRFNRTLFVSNRADLTPIRSINCTTARIYLHRMHNSETMWAVSAFAETHHSMRLNFIEITLPPGVEEHKDDENSERTFQGEEQSFTKFLHCANQLKNQFNKIYGTITKIASLNSAILRKDHPAVVAGGMMVKNWTRISGNGSVEEAKVSLELLTTPSELLKNVVHLNLRKLELQTQIDTAFTMSSKMDHTSSSERHRRQTDDDRSNEKAEDVKKDRIRVKNLRTIGDKWSHVLRKNYEKVQNLNVTSLKAIHAGHVNFTHPVNGINIEKDIYNNSSMLQNKMVNIFHCKHLIVKNSLNSIHVNDFFGLFAKSRGFDGTSALHVDQVIVENIQDMNFDEFYQSLFLRNSTHEIDGNLIFYNLTTMKEMETGTINGKPTDDLIPLHTNQIINSTIHINQFRVEHFGADRVNDIEFTEENLVLIGKDNHLKGPIQLYGLFSDDLTLAGDEEMTPERIIGTHIEDLSQVYMGQVTLKGNLHIGTLTIDSKNNFFGDTPFNLSSLAGFWYNSVDQDLTNAIFYGNITTPQLHTDFIDNHNAEDFLKTRDTELLKNTTFFVRTAHVGGDLKIRGTEEGGKVQTLANQISDSCIRVNERSVVGGVKKFTGNLRVKNLITSHLNDALIAKLVLKNFTHMKFPSLKHFTILEVTNGTNVSVLAGNVKIDSISAIDLRELIENSPMIDIAENIFFVQANAIKSRDIEVNTVNSMAFTKSIQELEEMKIHVNIQGNATFRQNINVDQVNGVNLSTFVPLVALKSQKSPLQIGGMKTFTENMRVLENLHVTRINDISVDNWLRNALLNGTKQTIKEKWTMEAVNCPKIDVDIINGIKVKHLMDTEGNATFQSNLIVDEITVNGGNVFGGINIDFNRTLQLLRAPTTRRWGTLRVERGVRWPLGSLSPLTELLTNAIHAERDQEIVGEVHILRATIEHLNSRWGVNGVDVAVVAQNSLRKVASHQVIFGDKHFVQPIQVENLKANAYLDIPLVNGVDISMLNATMLRKGENSIYIRDSWNFRGMLKTNHFTTHGAINNILPESLITSAEGLDTTTIPPAIFNNVHIVGNMTVTFIDKMPLDHLLYERGRKITIKNQDFRGLITFKDVILTDYANIYSINGMEINSLMLSAASEVQDVTGMKVCRGNLNLLGPSSVSYLNGHDIGEMYDTTLFLNRDHTVDEYGFSHVQLQNVLNIKDTLNGIHLETYKYLENSTYPDKRDIEEEIHRVMHSISESTAFKVAKKKRFIYFDYVNSTSGTAVGAPVGSSSPKVVRSVNIDESIPGKVCNNKSECHCSRQFSVKVLEDRNIVIRQVEKVRKNETVRAWNGVEIQVMEYHVENCISKPETRVNTTIIITVKHGGGKFTKSKEKFPGTLLHVDFLKSKSSRRDLLAIIASNLGNMTKIWLIKVDRMSGDVTRLNTISIFTMANAIIRPMEYKKHVYLIVGTTPKPAILDGSILVYKLMKNDTTLERVQTIEGNYLMIRCIDALGVVILSNRGSNFVNIFKLDDGSEHFKLFQSIILQSTLRTLNTFSLAENQFFLITLKNDYFLIYMYNYIEGWVRVCYHQYPNIESLTPFSLDGEKYLLAIGSTSAKAIALFSQTQEDN
ncbi:hypothetical protein DMENIID0001_123660 [Sergentomyia squamirostris]